jgi:3-methyladenine DNA glycosylase/8-oxoguanine DNA glycosylase
MAQDFHAAFAVGEDARYISTLDADGVALAAIQGLDQMVRERDERIKTQQEEFERQASQIASQQSEIEALQAHLARLESRVAGAATPSPSVYGPTLPWIVLGGLSLGSAWRRLRRSSIPTVSR